MEHSVFLSYRRSDTSGHAGRICDDLERHFRLPVVFRDIDAISVGSDFVQALEKAVATARVAIVLIGDSWLEGTGSDATRRLDDPADHVRREVAMALDNPQLTVIPVLVEGARMPDEQDLPEPLRRLARLQAIELSEQRWDYDMAQLVRILAAAGVERRGSGALPRWVLPVIGVLLVAMIAIAALCWWQSPAVERYTGLWYLPNGSFWTVREQEGGLWVDETHYESREVWRRGPAELDGEQLSAQLELVFDQRPFRYLHSLSLSSDGQILHGSVRRSDHDEASSLALTRSKP